MACDSIRAHTICFTTGQNNVCENRDVAVCVARAPNEMNACAQPYPNYREWKGGNKCVCVEGGKVWSCSVGGDGRKEWCAAMRKSQGSKKRFFFWGGGLQREDKRRPLAKKLLWLMWVFPFAVALFICLDSVSKALFWLQCLVVCCGLSSIHLLQWPHNLTIYSRFPLIFVEIPFSYLWLPPPPPPQTHTLDKVLIHVWTLICPSITGKILVYW